MAELVGAVTKITSGFLEINSISIDNWGFKFFYKWTTTLLVFCSVLVTASQFFGSPIYCDAGAARGGIEQDVLESYCWMYSTWNIPKEYKGACSGGDQDDSHDTIVYNSYYQWVPLYLIFLSVLFYMPRCFWLMMEGGLMKFFGKGTTTRFIEDQDEKREKLVQFFCRNIHNKYNIYFCGFVFCELLNLVIVAVQFVITHRFLHYRFLTYGFQVWQYYLLPPEEQRMPGVKNPMCNAFPRIANCDYWRWGSGGRQESINAICILALNIINDKVFLVLWWWFLMLVIIGSVRIIYRVLQCRSSRLRYHLINMRMNRYFKKSSKVAKIETFVCKCKLGDWFVLYQLSKNLNRPFFMDFLTQLSIRYTEKSAVVDEEDPEDSGDNLVSMLLKPSYTTQESEKPDDPGMDDGQVVGNHVQETRKTKLPSLDSMKMDLDDEAHLDNDKKILDDGADE